MSAQLIRSFTIGGHPAQYLGVNGGMEFYQVTVGGVRTVYGYNHRTRTDNALVAFRVPESTANPVQLIDLGD